MLASCSDSSSFGQRTSSPLPASSGVPTPGEGEINYGNISDKVLFALDSSLLQPEAQQCCKDRRPGCTITHGIR